jgi:hypothetical protein
MKTFLVTLINEAALVHYFGENGYSTVFHATHSTNPNVVGHFRDMVGIVPGATAKQYQLQAENLGQVFEILNIDHPADYRFRSLSVGDFIKDVETNEEWIVSPVGFTQVG